MNPILRPALALWITTAVAGTVPAHTETVQDRVRRYHDDNQFEGAVLIGAPDGKEHRAAFGFSSRTFSTKIRTDTRFPIASLTKQFTAVLALVEIERGRLDFAGTVEQYVPGLLPVTGREITILHLLTQSSGLPEPTDTLFRDPSLGGESIAELVDQFVADELTFPPGRSFQYTNSDSLVLGAILESVSEMPYRVLLQETVLDPLEMKDTGVLRCDQVVERLAEDYRWIDGHAAPIHDLVIANWHSAGAMYSTVEDLGKWNNALLEQRILSEDMTRQMKTVRSFGETSNYIGLGSWIYPRTLPDGSTRAQLMERRGAIGGYQALSVIDWSSGGHFVILSNLANADIHRLPYAPGLPYDLLSLLRGQPAPGPEGGFRAVSAQADASLESFTGKWFVDLRPSPDQPPYIKVMTLNVDGDEVSGVFYDQPIRDAELNDEFGTPHLAFTTHDGSGAYITHVRIEDDQVHGTTYSVGRGFLSVWSGVHKEQP